MMRALGLLASFLAVGVAASASAEEKPILDVPIVPKELVVHVYAVSLKSGLGDVPIWSYVSEGLARHRHKEIVFGVKREPGEDVLQPPSDIFALYRAIDLAASQHHLVDVGGQT